MHNRENWVKRINLRHLFTKSEDPEDIKKSMNGIVDALRKEGVARSFLDEYEEDCRKVQDLSETNFLIDELWDALDWERVWVNPHET